MTIICRGQLLQGGRICKLGTIITGQRLKDQIRDILVITADLHKRIRNRLNGFTIQEPNYLKPSFSFCENSKAFLLSSRLS